MTSRRLESLSALWLAADLSWPVAALIPAKMWAPSFSSGQTWQRILSCWFVWTTSALTFVWKMSSNMWRPMGCNLLRSWWQRGKKLHAWWIPLNRLPRPSQQEICPLVFRSCSQFSCHSQFTPRLSLSPSMTWLHAKLLCWWTPSMWTTWHLRRFYRRTTSRRSWTLPKTTSDCFGSHGQQGFLRLPHWRTWQQHARILFQSSQLLQWKILRRLLLRSLFFSISLWPYSTLEKYTTILLYIYIMDT